MASYRKRENGWEYRINYYDSTGKRKPKSKGGFRTKSEAIKAAAEMELKLQDNITVDEDITLYNYFKQWCEVYKKPTVSKITYKAYINTQRKIELFFSDKKLKSVTATQYQRVLNSYAKTHAQDTVERFNVHVKSCVEMSVHEGYIKRNFCKFAKINAKNKGRDIETKFLEVEEYERLIYETSKHPEYASYAALYIIAKTGIRFAECLGLTVDDINRDTGMLSVNKTWDYKGQGGFSPTKNPSSVRKIKIDWQTVVQFSELVKGIDDTQPLFVRGKVFNSTVNHVLARHCQALGIPVISIHGLRHTHASLLLFAGVSLASVARRLGHSSMTTTQKTYLHIIQELENQDVDLVMRLLAGLS